MGRRPKHPHLRMVEGNRGKRKIPTPPKPESSRPPCPAFLQKEARRHWKYLCHQLEKMGILGSSDQAVMVACCMEWEIAVLATRALQNQQREQDGISQQTARDKGEEIPPGKMTTGNWSDAFLAKTTNGNLVQQPLLGIANAAWDKCVRYACLLGCSPTDRAKISIETPKGKSLREELLGY
jgi:P27 family predicted phage terminase small subunit